MGFKDITAGEKRGKPVAMRLIESETKKLGMEVSFDFEEKSTGNRERLTRVFWLSKAAIEDSMETLIQVLGYNGSEVTDGDGVFTDPKVLNYDQEVSLVVEFETRRDKNGVAKLDKENREIMDPRIKWVNKLGGSGFSGLKPEVTKSKLAEIGFRAAFLAAKGNSPSQGGPKNHAPGAANNNPPEGFSDKEIPF